MFGTALFSKLSAVGAAWAASFKMLLPGNLKLLFLVTLKAVISFYKEAALHVWPFFVGYAVCAYLIVADAEYSLVLLAVKMLFGAVLLFAYYLFTRSSVDQKDWIYLRNYSKQIAFLTAIYYLMWAFLYGAITLDVIAGVHSLVDLVLTLVAFVVIPFLVVFAAPLELFIMFKDMVLPLTLRFDIAWYLIPVFSFFVLFIYDTHRFSCKSVAVSWWRALQMFIYNAPFCLVTGFVWYVVYAIVQTYVVMPLSGLALQNDALRNLVTELVMMALLPLGICWWSTLYIKRARDQFMLYCGKQC